MPRKARAQTSTNVYLLHASASQTHGTRCTRHTWTTANLNNIPSINVRHCGTRTGWPTKVGRVPVPLTLYNFNRFLQRNGHLCLITVCQAAHGIFY